MTWQATWAQATIDLRRSSRSIGGATLRMRPVATIGGNQVRIEFDNEFGLEPVEIGRAAVRVGTRSAKVLFEGQPAAVIPAEGSLWTDPLSISVAHSDVIGIEVYLPNPTLYATGNIWGAPWQASGPGDFVENADFVEGDDEQFQTLDGKSIPLSLPLVRSIDISGCPAKAVVVCLGDSITVGGWPERAAALLPPELPVAVLNRGIAGNRLRFDSVRRGEDFGSAGLVRFDRDVLATAGVTHVVVALGANDIGQPGSLAPAEQLPTVGDLSAAYDELVQRAQAAGVQVLLGTIAPFMPAVGFDEEREKIRCGTNEWIRNSATRVVDFDVALRASDDPTRLAKKYDSGDHLHPNQVGQERMARAIVDVIVELAAPD